MKLRQLYLLAGVLWALLLGPLIALGVFAMLAGVSWLYLFGDDPWPSATEWILPLAALTSGFAAAAVVVWAAGVEFKHRAAAAAADEPAERRRVMVWVGLPIVIAVLLGANGWWQTRHYAAGMQAAAAREAAFAELQGATHDITAIALVAGAERIRADIALDGERAGAYRLSWQVTAPSAAQALLAGMRDLQLTAGSSREELVIALDEIRNRYASGLLQGRGAALIDEMFRLEATLDPVLSDAEDAMLPPGERHRIDLGESPLQSRSDAQFPVRFTVP